MNTRPRVIARRLSGILFQWRLNDLVLEWADMNDDDWGPYTVDHPAEWKRVGPIYAELFANPTEEVEDV